MITIYLLDDSGKCWITGWAHSEEERDALIASWKKDFPERTAFFIPKKGPSLVGKILRIQRERLVLDKAGIPLYDNDAKEVIEREISMAKERFLLQSISGMVSPSAQQYINHKLKEIKKKSNATDQAN